MSAAKKPDTNYILFQNYDLYETKGVGGKNKVRGPGEGLFQNMDKYKSVSDFLKKKRRARRRRKSAMLLAIAFPDLVAGKTFKPEDENDSQDPYEDQGITPLAPLSPAEVSPIGMLDGMYPREDLEGKTVDNLYYGRLETHEFAVDDGHFAYDNNIDIKDAIEYMSETYGIKGKPFINAPIEMTLSDILTWDDYSSWGQWEPNELKNLSNIELYDELKSFRGETWAARATKWIKNNNIPPIILVDSNEERAIADGRGRTSLAVGLGLTHLPVIIIKFKSDNNDLQDPYEDQGITPLAPISPAEIDPIGMLDGIYPKSDLDGKSIENLYYGRLETHEYAASDHLLKDTNQVDDSELIKDVDQFGTIRYYDKNGKLHRDNDLPAEEFKSGGKVWYQHGEQHRDGDKPAYTLSDGHQEWWQHDKKHRDNDLPAAVYADGRKEWYQHGKQHREEGPAMVNPSGAETYYYHGVKKLKESHRLVQLWNGPQWAMVDWTETVLRLVQRPNIPDNTIWVYSENYEPLYQPKWREVADGHIPAATLHDINEGLPPPETGLKEDANITA